MGNSKVTRNNLQELRLDACNQRIVWDNIPALMVGWIKSGKQIKSNSSLRSSNSYRWHVIIGPVNCDGQSSDMFLHFFHVYTCSYSYSCHKDFRILNVNIMWFAHGCIFGIKWWTKPSALWFLNVCTVFESSMISMNTRSVPQPKSIDFLNP